MSDIHYRNRATKHAPKTLEEITRAARDLAASGFTDSTIGAILKIDTNSIRQLIGQRTTCPNLQHLRDRVRFVAHDTCARS